MKVVTIVGARPQFIKSAALSKAMKGKSIEEVLLHTGQHYDPNMSQVFFDELEIAAPKYNLNVGSGSHAQQTAKMMIGIEEVLVKEKPDCVILFGDTNSTLAGAVVAAKMNIPIAHVEAGLRCFLRYVPEEQNRIVADHLSTFNFTPSENGRKWLADEGITENVYNFGDIMVDGLLFYSEKAERYDLDYYCKKLLPIDNKVIKKETIEKGWCFSTIHRQENTDSLEKIMGILDALNEYTYPVILPLHPRTRHLLPEGSMEKYQNIFFVEPLAYMDTIYFAKHAKMVVTDSGGLHKECYCLKIPSVVIAVNSCWAETFVGNWATLASPQKDDITRKMRNINVDETLWSPVYGDGKAARRIVDKLIDKLSGNEDIKN